VEPDSSIVDKQISKIKFPKEAIIGAILRKGEMLIPDDEITLEAGDSVILVALPGAIEKIEKLFDRKRSFLPFR
jgi:trk system potassium uptake protein